MHVGVYVIPAKAGIQYHCLFLDSRLCGNDRLKKTFVMQLSIIEFFKGILYHSLNLVSFESFV